MVQSRRGITNGRGTGWFRGGSGETHMLFWLAFIGTCFVALVAMLLILTVSHFAGAHSTVRAEMYLSFPEPQVATCGANFSWGVRKLVETYRRLGYWPTLLRAIPSGDPRYGLRTMIWDYKRDPDLRPLLALTALPQLVLPHRRDSGMCPVLSPRQFLAGSMHSNYFTALTAEEILKWLEGENGTVTEEHRAALWDVLDNVTQDLLDGMQKDQKTGTPTWSYTHEPRIANKHLNETMKRWSRYSDMDSTSVCLSYLAKYIRQRGARDLHSTAGGRLATIRRAEHAVKFRGIGDLLSGQIITVVGNILPQAQRMIGPQQRQAVATFITDGPNDIDPGVNVNALKCILECYGMWSARDKARAAQVTQSVFDYLSALRRCDCLFDPNQHLYYAFPAYAYLWVRMRKAYISASPMVREALDPSGAFTMLDTQVHEKVKRLLAIGEPGRTATRLSYVDRLLLQIVARAYGRTITLEPWPAQLAPHEFFYGLYPVKVVYASAYHLLAVMLSAIHAHP